MFLKEPEPRKPEKPVAPPAAPKVTPSTPERLPTKGITVDTLLSWLLSLVKSVIFDSLLALVITQRLNST